MRDYRTHLQAVLKRSPAPINNGLAAVDDLYLRLGLGPAALRAAQPVLMHLLGLSWLYPYDAATAGSLRYLGEAIHFWARRGDALPAKR